MNPASTRAPVSPTNKTSPLLMLACAVLLTLILPSQALHADEGPVQLFGEWILDSEKTQELQPEQKGGGGSGFSVPSISVGGVFIPVPGSSSGGAGGSGGARDPRVLRCPSMTVAMQGENVHFIYQGVGEEVMKPGNDQGRKTRWKRSKLTQTYQTTSRKVSKNYEVQADGSLHVKVKINPKGAKGATHIRVFQPAP